MHGALLLLLLAPWTPQRAPIPVQEPSLGERLEKLIPRAAGVAEVEVEETKRVDHRDGDGDLSLEVRFRILRSTGATRERIAIVEAFGGYREPESPEPKPWGPVDAHSFVKGRRYWVAFSSQYDWQRCPQGIVSAWPQREAPALFAEAIRADHYAHRPQYDPKSGLTHSDRADPGGSSWTVRMERNGKILWEVSLPGVKFQDEKHDGELRLMHREQWPSGLEHVEANRSGWYLLAETASRLESTNPFGLSADRCRQTHVLDADDGRKAAVWVSRPDRSPLATPYVVQYFDPSSGGIRREERIDFLEHGGVAAGSKEEKWLRKIVRTLDPVSGQVLEERVFRSAPTPNGTGFVPVDG